MEVYHNFSFPFLLAIIVFFSSGVRVSQSARMFTIVNDCKETIWPAITPGADFGGGGFALKSGESRVFSASITWSGRIWGRTGCNFNKDGVGPCETGSCGTNLKCEASGEPPASLAEFTLAERDFYDVSLVDGFNLPISVTPLHGNVNNNGNVNDKGTNCSVAGCDGDLRRNCPKELAVREGGNGKVVACRSACDVFNTDQYCCRGNYGNPSTCQPTYYSKKFKEACPTSYSYAYDDPTSIFICTTTPDYVITFCSPRNQTVCTYHNNKLACSGSSGLHSFLGLSLIILLSLTLILNFWIVV